MRRAPACSRQAKRLASFISMKKEIRNEETSENESFEGSPEKKECKKELEKVQRGKKVSFLNIIPPTPL